MSHFNNNSIPEPAIFLRSLTVRVYLYSLRIYGEKCYRFPVTLAGPAQYQLQSAVQGSPVISHAPYGLINVGSQHYDVGD